MTVCSYSLSKLGQNPGSATPVYLHVLEMPHTVSLSSDPSVQSASDNIKIHIYTSVAEPPLFWAALAPEVRGPGADSGSDKMGRLRL